MVRRDGTTELVEKVPTEEAVREGRPLGPHILRTRKDSDVTDRTLSVKTNDLLKIIKHK